MLVIGLTGSIAMGKSTAARMMRRWRWPIFDSDLEVHRLMRPGGKAVAQVLSVFPSVRADDGGIDRRKLGREVTGKPEQFRKLEQILHPMVRRLQEQFLKAARRRRIRHAVLDVPLLFETGGHLRCDLVLVLSAPAVIQRQRALSRPGMTPSLFKAILSRQLPDWIKRRGANRVIPSGAGRRATMISLMRARQYAEIDASDRSARARARRVDHLIALWRRR